MEMTQYYPEKRNRKPLRERPAHQPQDIPAREWSDGNRPRREGAAPDLDVEKFREFELGVPSIDYIYKEGE